MVLHSPSTRHSLLTPARMGSKVLMMGAGPTGLVLAQMLRQNGGCNVLVAAPEGLKMELAKKVRKLAPQSFRGVDFRKAWCW